MKRVLIIVIGIIIFLWLIVNVPNWAIGIVNATDCSIKCPEPPDPNRPSFDAAGNKYDYMGNLIEAVSPPHPTGCPYGDSIPLDSPKCAPQEVKPFLGK